MQVGGADAAYRVQDQSHHVQPSQGHPVYCKQCAASGSLQSHHHAGPHCLHYFCACWTCPVLPGVVLSSVAALYV